MSYQEFLALLKATGWVRPDRSFVYRVLDGGWQVSFIRLGGRYNVPDFATFVICVRHTSLRDLEGVHHEIEKEPHCHPFKLTLAESEMKAQRYQSRVLNYEMSSLGLSADWLPVVRVLTETIPAWLAVYSTPQMRMEIEQFGQGAYIEKIWLDDLHSGKEDDDSLLRR